MAIFDSLFDHSVASTRRHLSQLVRHAFDRLVRRLPEALLVACTLVHLLTCPYTKVEESFNVQATHDLLYTTHLGEYDHLEFPGVVPRTFVAPIVLASFARPIKVVGELVGLPTKEDMIVIVRFFLGALFLASFHFLRAAFAQKFRDPRLPSVAAVLACCQFHLLFYCSRPLANTIATVLVNVALTHWVLASIPVGRASASNAQLQSEQEAHRARSAGLSIAWLAAACILFRCDMLILALCIILASFACRWITVGTFLQYGTLASMACIAVSVCVDSYYWQRPVWPEWEVLYFNTLKRDSEGRMFTGANAWGTEPFYWYIANALPKSMMATIVLLPMAMVKRLPTDWRDLRTNARAFLAVDIGVLQLLLPLGLFLFLYSFLAHKELRFIYPILPTLTCIAAVGWRKLADARERAEAKETKKEEGALRTTSSSSATERRASSTPPAPARAFHLIHLVSHVVRLLLVLSACVVVAWLYISSWNYPGGYALTKLHAHLRVNHATCRLVDSPAAAGSGSTDATSERQATSNNKPLVHIGNLAATTGASRFGQRDECARYTKQEGLQPDQYQHHPFDYLIAEQPKIPGFVPMRDENGQPATVSGFAGVRRHRLGHLPPVEVLVQPMLWLMQRETPWKAPAPIATPDELEVDVSD